MLFAVLTVRSPGQSEVLDGISRAFFAALDRDVSVFEIGVWSALAIAAAFVVVGWLRGDAESELRERRALEQRREQIASEAPPRLERREWLRVSTNRVMKVAHVGASERPLVDILETRDIGGGGLSFLSESAPRRGTRLSFTLDLGQRRPLAVRGTVVRVTPPREPGAASLVAVKFGEMSSATHERLVRWVVEEARREIVAARRGRLCACCERPLADGTEEMHPTCAERVGVKHAA